MRSPTAPTRYSSGSRPIRSDLAKKPDIHTIDLDIVKTMAALRRQRPHSLFRRRRASIMDREASATDPALYRTYKRLPTGLPQIPLLPHRSSRGNGQRRPTIRRSQQLIARQPPARHERYAGRQDQDGNQRGLSRRHGGRHSSRPCPPTIDLSAARDGVMVEPSRPSAAGPLARSPPGQADLQVRGRGGAARARHRSGRSSRISSRISCSHRCRRSPSEFFEIFHLLED